MRMYTGAKKNKQKKNGTTRRWKNKMPRKRRSEQRALRFIVPVESEGSIVRTLWARAGSPLGGGRGGGAALWPAQLSFLVSSRGLYLAAPQRCHCDLFKAMSSSRHDNMSLALQRHHRIAAAKKQIASIDPAPLQPPPYTPSCFSDANRQERGGLP